MSTNRRRFLQQIGGLAAGFGVASSALAACGSTTNSPEKNAPAPDSSSTAGGPSPAKLFFEISLAQWSLHKALFDKKIDNLDFPLISKRDYGISVVEYVNQFFKDKAKDEKYLGELLNVATTTG